MGITLPAMGITLPAMGITTTSHGDHTTSHGDHTTCHGDHNYPPWGWPALVTGHHDLLWWQVIMTCSGECIMTSLFGSKGSHGTPYTKWCKNVWPSVKTHNWKPLTNKSRTSQRQKKKAQLLCRQICIDLLRLLDCPLDQWRWEIVPHVFKLLRKQWLYPCIPSPSNKTTFPSTPLFIDSNRILCLTPFRCSRKRHKRKC